MPRYETVNVKFSNSQLNESKSGIKNGSEVTLNLSSNAIGDCNHDNSFFRKILSTGKQVSSLSKVFANNSSSNIKLSKTQLSRTMESG